ncbi:MAG: phospholipase [Bacteroidota bacterium]
MSIKAHKIPVQRTAHFYTIGEPSPEVEYLWIVCHGYGQLAKNFIRKFDVLASPNTLIVAPEGLSRFYWGGVTGEVVASWMTKEDRLDEIADYANMLSQIKDQLTPQLSPKHKTILFGFSQGCATQVRWIMAKKPEYDALVLWAGAFPEDLDYNAPTAPDLNQKPNWFIYGDKDQYLTPKRIAMHEELIKSFKLKLEVIQFEGTHRVDRTVLKELSNQIYPFI